MLMRNRLKGFKTASRLLGPCHQDVLSLVEDSDPEGITVDDLILYGFDHTKILEALQELQWPGLFLQVMVRFKSRDGIPFRRWRNG